MTTPIIDSPFTKNISFNNLADESVPSPVLQSGGSNVDFSLLWTFFVDRSPSSNPNPHNQPLTDPGVTIVGLSTGIILLQHASSAFNLYECAQYQYAVFGSTDSGVTHSFLGTGKYEISVF